MTFSQFAKVMYVYCNEGETKSDFVIHLINKIMHGHPRSAHADGTYQNPMLGKDDRTLLNYFNGDRSISSKDASTIRSSIDKKKFKKYIEKRCSDDAQVLLLKDLLEVEAIQDKGNVPKICTQLFVKILQNL